MIQLNNVTKRFSDMTALDHVTINIPKASIYGILGSNGAGKSTLLKLIAGIYNIDGGSVQIDEKDAWNNIAMKDKMIFISDIPYFLPQYTVRQMANYYRHMYSGWSDEVFKQLSGIFKIDHDKVISRLSKGMQRQVAFWLAFSAQPDLLVLDEPMDGLDPVMRFQVRKMLIDNVANREMTVVIASHNLKEVEDMCDIVAVLHLSELLFERDLDDLRTDIHKLQIIFKEGIPKGLLEEIAPLHYEKRGRALICIARGEQEKLLTAIEAHLPVVVDVLPLTLEEIFIHEMGDKGYAFENIID